MRKFAISGLLLIPSIALADPYRFANVENSSIEILSKQKIIINEYDYRSPPELHFTETVTNCTINGNSCDSKNPIKFTPPQNVHGPVQFSLKYLYGEKSYEREIQLFPNHFPAYEFIGESKLQESIVLTPDAQALIISPKGEIQYYKKFPFFIEDFRPHKIDGKTFFSFLKVAKINHGLNIEGHRWVLDLTMRHIKSFSWLMDMHDFVMESLDHVYFIEYKPSTTFSGNCFVDKEVKEFRGPRLVFSLSVSELLRRNYLYGGISQFQLSGKSCYEFLHINTLQPTSNNGLLINLGSDGLMAIDTKTKKPLWIFSGVEDQFQLSNDLKPCMVHTPIFDEKNSKLTLFENSRLNCALKQSSIVEYDLDLKNKIVKKYFRLSIDPFYAQSMGSVEKNGNIFTIGTGEKNQGEYDVIEHSDNNSNFKIRFHDKNLGTKLQPVRTYRVYRTKF